MKKFNEAYNQSNQRNVDFNQPVNILDSSLKKVVRGTVIVIIGTIISMPLAFLTKVILARFFTPSEFGIFSLGFSIINILVVIALLGLSTGSTRQIAFQRGKKNSLQVKEIINSSIQISLIASIILALTVILASDFLSTNIFHNSALSTPLKVFAISIPFITTETILISIFIGFDRVEEQVYFDYLLRNILFILFLLPVIFFSFTFHYAIIAFLISYIITLFILIIYTEKRLPFSFINKTILRPNLTIYKDLLAFSVPLLTINLFQLILSWADTLMLGAFKTVNEVGQYNAAQSIGGLISIPMGALLFIYAPIITGLYAKASLSEINRNYCILTKWVFLISLPLSLVIFLYPQIFLSTFFGSNYVFSSQALQVIALGNIIFNLLGPNGTTLVAIGETRFLMWASIAAAGLNIILNIVLIPPLGILGASIATSIAIFFHCVIRQIKVHSILKMNPITKNLLKPTLISVPVILVIWYLVRTYFIVTIWVILFLFILYIFVIFFVLIFTRSLDNEDIMMVLEIEKILGINLSSIKKLLNKFI